MNHCRRCDSDYEKPGTCNCFAQAPREAVPVPDLTSGWATYYQCPHCYQWYTGSHLCYVHVPSYTTGTITIKSGSLTPYQVYDHVMTEAARRAKPQGVHVPPLT